MCYGLWPYSAGSETNNMATKRIVLLIAITGLLIASAAVPALALLANGTAAPSFSFRDLSGNVHTLSEYRGKVVVIQFFGADCGYCQSDAKDTLVPLYNTYYKNDAKVQFLGMEIDGSSNSAIQQYVGLTGVPWPVGSGVSPGVAYQVSSTPTLYVISPAGNIALVSTYPTNAQTLRSTIDALESSSTPSIPAHLFVQGTDHALWSKYQSGSGWSGWQSLGGSLTSSPAVISPTSGVFDVFARGTDGALWGKTTTNNGATWSGWEALGGQIASGTGPAVCTSGSRLDVFAQGTNGALYQKTWDGTSWSGWQSLGGNLTSSPAAGSTSAGVIDVFARGTDGALWQQTTTNGGATWSGWEALGGQIASGTGPAVCTSGSRLDVFAQGTNGALYQRTWTGSWSNWISLGGSLTSSPAAISTSGVFDVFARGTDGAAWYKDWSGTAWSSWHSLGGQIASGTGPAACV
jgi:thiol-disulfide isomerase/thioredoxin